MCAILNADSQDVVSKIIQENDTFLFDCDGVLWGSGHIFPGVAETLQKLHGLGKKVLFVTNNSTKSRKQYLEKIVNYGIGAKLEEVYCTAYTCALYLKDKIGLDEQVYVVGNPSIGSELDKLGIKHFGIGPDDSIRNVHGIGDSKLRPNVKAVVTGFDDYFGYAKMTKAISYLAREGTLFVATNMDANFPVKNTEFRLPGTGALISSIITAAERQPTVICGKPDSLMIDCIKAESDFDPGRAIMIGDRLDTDILFGRKNGLKTLVVLTGVTTASLLEQIQQSSDPVQKNMIPDYYIGALPDIAKFF